MIFFVYDLETGELTYTGNDTDQRIRGASLTDDNLIYALGGTDWVELDGGDNTVYAGTGNDRVVTGEGDDGLHGNADDDTLIDTVLLEG